MKLNKIAMAAKHNAKDKTFTETYDIFAKIYIDIFQRGGNIVKEKIERPPVKVLTCVVTQLFVAPRVLFIPKYW